MNKENILKVADAIERHSIPDLGFNMSYCVVPGVEGIEQYKDRYGTKCGTVACIAGWARAVRTERIPEVAYSLIEFVIKDEADWLGLSNKAATELFYPESLIDSEDALAYDTLTFVTPGEAVAVLRHLAETGEVDWSVADKVNADVA